MNLLEKFYILFSSNADEVEEGADKAGKATDDLDKKLKSADKSARKLGEGFIEFIRGMAGGIASAIAGLVSIGALYASVIASAGRIDGLRRTAEELRVNIGELDAWGKAVEASGGRAEDFQNTLGNLNGHMREIALTGTSGVVPYLYRFGIQMRNANGQLKTGMELLPQLADAFQGLSRVRAEGLAQKLGIDTRTMLLLMQGRKAVEDAVRKEKEYGVVTERQAEAARKYQMQLQNTRKAYQALSDTLAQYALPILERFLGWMEKAFNWIRGNGRRVSAAIIAIAAGLTTYLIPALKTATLWMLRFIVPAILPLLKLVAIFGALYLVIEDVLTYLEGGDSITGRLLESFKEMGEGVKKVFLDLWNDIVKFFSDLKQAARDAVNFLGFGGNFSATMNAQDALSMATSSPLASMPSGAISAGVGSRSIGINVGEITVNTQATDAQGISKAIGNTLADQLRQTSAQYDDGIRG